MEKDKKPSPFSILWRWAGPYHHLFSGSVVLAVIGVAGEMLPYYCMVFQNVYLFNDTIENNIMFGNTDTTHDEVVAAAKAACCDEFISALPDGYDTMLGEGGGTLSGGEKQRISIARAMLKNAPIIVLD